MNAPNESLEVVRTKRRRIRQGAPALNLICTSTALDTVLETTFIQQVLLDGLNRPLRLRVCRNNVDVPITDDALFLVLNSDLLLAVRRAIREGCRNVGVLHMGDEFFENDRSYYPIVDYVLRNYHRGDALLLPPNARCKEVMWIPNGYRSGVGPQDACVLLEPHLREHPIVFAGCLTTGGAGLRERAEMMDAAQAIKAAMIVTTPGFGLGLCANVYAALMRSARFALVPSGRNPETIRLYDALEAGAIPITLRHSFLSEGGPMYGAPFVFLNSWKELPRWLRANATANCKARNVERQQKCLRWWASFKDIYRRRVAALIDASFAATVLNA